VELHGEAIFLDLDPENAESDPTHFPLNGQAEAWLSEWQNSADPVRGIARQAHVHPIFVWWHTLAHRFITALSVDSGYSSSAIRERVYVELDQATGQGRGGVLLYTAQPGGDGTLGGLISLVPHFGAVLDSALRNLDACSNDPLCEEERFTSGRYNGAACYACLLVSETSCERRNTSLDRLVVLQNSP
jgi:hypothetical protein